MNKLKPEVEMAIERMAKKHAVAVSDALGLPIRSPMYEINRHNHAAGATPWAEMAQELAEALEFYNNLRDPDIEYKAANALASYQQLLKGEADEV